LSGSGIGDLESCRRKGALDDAPRLVLGDERAGACRRDQLGGDLYLSRGFDGTVERLGEDVDRIAARLDGAPLSSSW
jgi:hypothetical protein